MPPRSRYELMAGAVIPAALITELNSEQPGRAIAQVTANVYDSVYGAHLLIPQGARLIDMTPIRPTANAGLSSSGTGSSFPMAGAFPCAAWRGPIRPAPRACATASTIIWIVSPAPSGFPPSSA
ncbi:MAG: hypothetical protein IPL62_19325 [Caulobacteraceae bacterium]|nr:hypothetical protein [Caulobacteraceae bacterium]